TADLSSAELRQRQEIIMRNQMMAVNSQILVPTQQRMPMMPAQFEPRLLERDLLPSPDLILPNDARQMHVASHFGPAFPSHTNVLSNRIFTGPGYSILPTEPMDIIARRQEILQKQNMNRMNIEMNSIYQPKEIDKSHRKIFTDLDSPFLYPGMASSPVAFRGRPMLPEGHLPADVFAHRNTFENFHCGSMMKTSSPYPAMSHLQRERVRRPGRRTVNQKTAEGSIGPCKIQTEIKTHISPTATEGEKDKKEEETDVAQNCDQEKMCIDPAMDKNSVEEEPEKNDTVHKISREITISRSGNEKELNNPVAAYEDRYMYQPPVHLSTAPYSFPVTMNLPMLSGSHGIFLNREDNPSVQDMHKWTSQDVYNFVISLPGCSSYAQVFKDHDIDGLTLPLLTEDHLLDTLGLKLGPALKIRSQISCLLGNIFHMTNLPIPGSVSSVAPLTSEQPPDCGSPILANNSSDLVTSPCSKDPDNRKTTEIPTPESKEIPCDLSIAQTDFQINFSKN
ncbi:sterile alpha motif domain-containing protein 7, partial [Bombina bombina]|uniref:sterile alpha motif domain-containing protein 7 n=1 Tax=Bombina bombina TaxID=8345 RepID=UPI00235A632A